MGRPLTLNLVWERLARSILTRVSEILFLTSFDIFFRLFFIFNLENSVEYVILDLVWIFFSIFCIEICVGGPVILDLVWERLSRSI